MEFNIILINWNEIDIFIIHTIFGIYTIEIWSIFSFKEIEKLKFYKQLKFNCFSSRLLGHFPSLWIDPLVFLINSVSVLN